MPSSPRPIIRVDKTDHRSTCRLARRVTSSVSRPSGFVLVVVALTGCVTPHVMSPYGDMCGVNHMPDNRCRPRTEPHDGVDFGPGSVGDVVIASADGLVLRVDTTDDAGTEVVVMHALDVASHGSYSTGYLHLRRSVVHKGDRVERGQAIGELGLFRKSAGVVHVHWRLWHAGEPLDPMLKAVGCFDGPRRDVEANLELTFPLPC